jgi:soluble lytic murein transglycosylase-like protein
VIEVESKWRPNAVSPAGAVGLMQLMPATAVTFGVRNRFRIADNVQGGVAYLGRLMRRFGGDLRLVAAGYLVGEGRVAARGLGYSSPVVHDYVNKVARVYRKRKLETLQGR